MHLPPAPPEKKANTQETELQTLEGGRLGRCSFTQGQKSGRLEVLFVGKLWRPSLCSVKAAFHGACCQGPGLWHLCQTERGDFKVRRYPAGWGWGVSKVSIPSHGTDCRAGGILKLQPRRSWHRTDERSLSSKPWASSAAGGGTPPSSLQLSGSDFPTIFKCSRNLYPDIPHTPLKTEHIFCLISHGQPHSASCPPPRPSFQWKSGGLP